MGMDPIIRIMKAVTVWIIHNQESGVVETNTVPPYGLLFTGAERQLAGREHEMGQHGQGYQRTADLSHISGLEETRDRVHHPAAPQVNVDTGHEYHVAH